MAAQIDNTPTATQKGAPLPAQNQCANQSSHGAGNNSRNPKRLNHIPKINRHKIAWSRHSSLATSHCFLATLGDGHAVPSIFDVTPAPSTNVEKLMDTVSRASSAPTNVTSQCYVSRFERAGWSPSLLRAVTCSLVTVFFIDTHDEENSRLTSTESTRSQKFHRYTFDMLRTQKGGSKG